MTNVLTASEISPRPYVKVSISGTEPFVREVSAMLELVIDWVVCDKATLEKYLALGVRIDNSKMVDNEFYVIEKEKRKK